VNDTTAIKDIAERMMILTTDVKVSHG